MCAGREFQVEGADTEKAREKKVASNTGWSGKDICIVSSGRDHVTPAEHKKTF